MGSFDKTNRQVSCSKNIKRLIWWTLYNEKFSRHWWNTTCVGAMFRFKAATKLKLELPAEIEMESVSLMEIWSLAEDIHVNTQDTDLHMQEFVGIIKALQSIQGEVVNNTSKLREIDKHIKRIAKN